METLIILGLIVITIVVGLFIFLVIMLIAMIKGLIKKHPKMDQAQAFIYRMNQTRKKRNPYDS